MTEQSLLEKLRLSAPRGDRFAISAKVERSYVGRSPEGRASLLVPCGQVAGTLGRAFGQLLLQFRSRVSFDVDGRSWDTAAAVLECLDETLLPTFLALATDVASQLADAQFPSPDRILRAVAPWERLLRSHPPLSDDEQLGLWGELQVIRNAPSLDGAIRAWAPNSTDTLDFAFGGIAVEVKTSTTPLRHTVSHHQVRGGDGAVRLLFASIWAVPDAAGQSIPDLVDALSEASPGNVPFETRLLSAGYSRRDADIYTRRLSLGRSPLLFESSCVPRVRTFDRGVTALRYAVELDPELALSDEAREAALSMLCGFKNQPS